MVDIYIATATITVGMQRVVLSDAPPGHPYHLLPKGYGVREADGLVTVTFPNSQIVVGEAREKK